MSNKKQNMKKLLIMAILIGMMSSCNQKATVKTQQTNIVTPQGGEKIQVVIIEGCEYLELAAGHRYSLCHKGNCKNPIHKGGNNEQQ